MGTPAAVFAGRSLANNMPKAVDFARESARGFASAALAASWAVGTLFTKYISCEGEAFSPDPRAKTNNDNAASSFFMGIL